MKELRAIKLPPLALATLSAFSSIPKPSDSLPSLVTSKDSLTFCSFGSSPLSSLSVHSANMKSYVDHANARDYASPPSSYPQGPAYAEGKPPAYVTPPPVGYPMNSTATYSEQAPAKTRRRGDGFWKGCCAALCCCCVLDMCF